MTDTPPPPGAKPNPSPQAGPLTDPILADRADMTIAVFAATVKLGGHGLVVGLSGAGIRRAVGWQPAQPLNGQRCLTRAAFEAARPLARGWGVETALTIDLVRQGFRVTGYRLELVGYFDDAARSPADSEVGE